MSDLFISHVEEDRALVTEVAAGLERAGYTTWYYERDSLPGVPYARQIPTAIDDARAVVLVLSRDALTSPHVNGEVSEAYRSGKPFMPLLHGLGHFEFRQLRRDWALMLGTAVFLTIPATDFAATVPRIAAGLRELGVSPSGSAASPAPQPRIDPSRQAHSAPPASPAQKPPAATPPPSKQTSAAGAGGRSATDLDRNRREGAVTRHAPPMPPRHTPGRSTRRKFVGTLLPAAFIGGGGYYAWTHRNDDDTNGNGDETVTPVVTTSNPVEFKHDGSVFSLAVHPSEPLFATGAGDKKIRLWNLERPDEEPISFAEDDQARSVAFNHDGSLLAVGTIDSHSARIWITETQKQFVPDIPHSQELYAVAFSSDGSVFATGCKDAYAKLWNPDRQFVKTASLDHDSWVYSLAFHVSRPLMATGTASALVRVYDVNMTNSPIAEFHHDGETNVFVVAFSPVGSILATGGSDTTVRLWDYERDIMLSRLEHDAIVRGIAYRPDGTMLATGNNDGTLRIYRLDRNGANPVLHEEREGAHGSFIRAMAFTPDGSKLLTAANDSLVRVWTTDLEPVQQRS